MERNAMIAGALGAFGLFAVGSAVAIGAVYYGLHGDEPAVLAPAAAEDDDVVGEMPRGRAAKNDAPSSREVAAAERAREQMAQPDARYATELVGPMIGIRRRLQAFGPEGDALGSPGDATVGKLRENHRNPAAHPWSELAAEVQAFAASVRASQWASDPAIAAQLTRIDTIIAEHDAAVAGG